MRGWWLTARPAAWPVLIILAVRRFRCPDRPCAKATFAEQAEDLSVRYRRRSVPLLGMLAAFGLELGGRAGSPAGRVHH